MVTCSQWHLTSVNFLKEQEWLLSSCWSCSQISWYKGVPLAGVRGGLSVDLKLLKLPCPKHFPLKSKFWDSDKLPEWSQIVDIYFIWRHWSHQPICQTYTGLRKLKRNTVLWKMCTWLWSSSTGWGVGGGWAAGCDKSLPRGEGGGKKTVGRAKVERKQGSGAELLMSCGTENRSVEGQIQKARTGEWADGWF